MSSKLAATILVVFATTYVVGQDEIGEREIQAAFASPDSTLRNSTWKKLTAEKEAHYKHLVRVLRTLSWYDRQAAVEALAKAATDATLKKMVRDLKTNKDPSVRMGMADAIAKMNDEKIYAELYEALKDKSPTVRRMVVYYLRVHRKKEAVQALIDLLQTEKNPVVQAFTVSSLDELTKAYLGQDPIAWFTWWEQAKADKNFELGKDDKDAQKKAEELGNKLKSRTTTTASARIETEELGSKTLTSVPILILPEYGVSKEVMKPFLKQLARTNRLFFIDLPPIKDFTNLPTIGATKMPYYPIDLMVEAFEKLRQDTGQDRFAIMACGMNSWIGMRYACLYPESVSHLVLIAPIPSGDGYGNATKRMEQEGQARNDIELWHLGLSRRINSETGEGAHDQHHREKKIPKPDGEDAAIDRRRWSLFFKDERDSLLGMLYPVSRRDLGGVLIPDYRCFKEQPPKKPVPTIVITGKNPIYTTVEDCKAIAKHFGGVCYVYENSSCMPFAEESELFNQHLSVIARERATPAKGKGKAKGKNVSAEEQDATEKKPDGKASKK